MNKFILLNIFVLFSEIIHIAYSDKLLVEDNINVPCSYYDTVDLTNSQKFQNGSYLYEGILIPEHLVGIYNYHLKSLVSRITAKPHIRGCICLVKTCVNWCCDGKDEYLDDISCINTNETSSSTEITIRVNSFENKTIDLYKFFFPQIYYLPCEREHMYDLSPESYKTDQWELFENATLYRNDDSKFFLKREYCLSQSPDYNTMEFKIKPFICNLEIVGQTRNYFYAYAMMFSIPFMIITIIIYIIIPELRNLHGKSLVCYLSGLVVAYSVFGYLLLTSGKSLSSLYCAVLGFIAYFFFMSSFFWLSVISFDLFWNFRNTGRNRSKGIKRFLYFGLYSWGLAFAFLGFAVFSQYSDLIPIKYKPGIGNEFCWLDVKTNFSATIYLFAPVLCIIIFNSIMFGMTSWKIYHVQREMGKFITREESRRNLNSERNQFGLFLRLFLIMGVTWSAEIISYFLGESQDHIFYILDFLNMIQGFLIFALFVLKKKVRDSILKRFSKSGDDKFKRYSSVKTTRSTMTSNNLQNTESATN